MNLTRRGLFNAIAGTAALAPFAAKAREWTTITVDEVIHEVTPTDSPFLMVGKQNAPQGTHDWVEEHVDEIQDVGHWTPPKRIKRRALPDDTE